MTDTTLTSIYQASPEFLSQLKLWIEQAGIAIPVNQLVGFSQFVVSRAVVDVQQSTSSTTYTDLTTVGPSFTKLPPGKYVFLLSCLAIAGVAAGDYGHMGLSIGGSTPADADAIQIFAQNTVSVLGIWATTATLTDPNGTDVVAKYRMEGINADTGMSFDRRWVLSFKYA